MREIGLDLAFKARHDSDAVSVGRRVLAAESSALGALADSLGPDFAAAVEILLRAGGRVVVSGVGKSGHVARKIAATFSSTGTPALFMHAGEAAHGDLGMVSPTDVILALSKSGEAREMGDVLSYAKRFGIPLLAITASRTSPLGAAADLVLELPDVAEATAEVSAPTTSTTLQMALGDALAVALLERRGFSAAHFHVYHPGGKLGAQLQTVATLMHTGEAVPLTTPDASMGEALLVMTERRLGCVGVQDANGTLLGLITDGDLRRHLKGLLDRTASQVMTPRPYTVAPGDLAAGALKVMQDRMITVLFVVEDGQTVGVLHIHDLLRAGVV